MLDPLTLRVAMTAVAATLLVLSYAGVYLRDRSRFSGWWSAALVMVAIGTALYTLNGTSVQALSTPAANAISVTGAVFTWAAARSLRGAGTGRLRLAAAPAGVLVVTAFDSPATDIWAGGAIFLAATAGYFGLAAHAMWRVRQVHRDSGGRYSSAGADRATMVLGFGVGSLSALYAVRTLLFVAVGPDDALFEDLAGTIPTTLVLIVALVVVTFTMTELSQAERVFDLEIRATRDALTGTWNRAEFERRASVRLEERRGRSTLVVADLDHFKALNDAHGHAAGDRALEAFGTATRHALGPRDVAGRLGGEEFAILLATDDVRTTQSRIEALRLEFAELAGSAGAGAPTVSYGIAAVAPDESFEQALRRADAAMYQAKRDGRDRVVVHGAR
ncbi:GGDEF domain-containing protein [Demequina mangrovi]|uniref:Diguanylate cyclase (GGDEF) domain-containing protein n=1 Tax=Demequina mangrovi TaxID=1043493 RepID=A0A1H6V8C5_9MICO|nr:GGDEF domain-containing protein [Demequina mangrovi]SEJ00066.1 diguanylate cyclase (GGDEF) domain-containing protein [Demequina mangrovi]